MSLIKSIWNNDIQTLKTLIAGKADVNVVNEYGRTALWNAADKNHVECATALLNAKADVHKADEDGYTPLHRASLVGRAECVRVRLFVWCLNVTDVIPFRAL
jgi:ankyrin repeat protein